MSGTAVRPTINGTALLQGEPAPSNSERVARSPASAGGLDCFGFGGLDLLFDPGAHVVHLAFERTAASPAGRGECSDEKKRASRCEVSSSWPLRTGRRAQLRPQAPNRPVATAPAKSSPLAATLLAAAPFAGALRTCARPSIRCAGLCPANQHKWQIRPSGCFVWSPLLHHAASRRR